MTTANKVSPSKQKKIDIVSNLKEKLCKAKAVFLTDYRGLTHQQIEKLRKALKKVEADFFIVKNRLLKIAINDDQKNKNQEQKEQLKEELNNPTAALFAYGDEMAAVKELSNFIKNINLPKVKIGLFEGKAVNEADFQKLANLPDKKVLLAILLSAINSPLYGLHYALSWNMKRLAVVLNNIKDKK